MPRIRTVQEPVTGISVAPTIAAHWSVFSPEQSSTVAPATQFVALQNNFTVSTCTGDIPFPAAFAAIPEHVIPGVFVESNGAADELLAWLEQTGVFDLLVASTDANLVRRLRERNMKVRSAVVFTEAVSAPEIRDRVNRHNARVAIVPGRYLNRALVAELQRRLVTVWALHDGAGDIPPHVAHTALLTLGVNGIVTTDIAAATDALEAFPPGTTVLARKPLIIGHRGMPARAPENTLASAKLAYAHGADMIENDVHITTDGVVVIHHDETLERTTTGTGRIEDHSYAALRAFTANIQFPEQFPDERIPTLRAFLEEFRDTDIVHVVELKSENERLVPAIAQLVEELDVAHQVVAISFIPEQLRRFRKYLPGVSCGFLTFGQVTDDTPGSVLRVLQNIQPLSSTYNPRFIGIDAPYLEAVKHRGVTQWPWTYPDFEPFATSFLAGMNGLTTNHSFWSETWLASVRASASTVELAMGEQHEFFAHGVRYDRSAVENIPVTVRIVAGDAVTVAGSTVTATKPGASYLVLLAEQAVDDERSYTVLTEVVTVVVRS